MTYKATGPHPSASLAIDMIIINMNKVNVTLNITYRNLLFENGVNINEIYENYKKQLKTLIQENIPGAKFVKSKCANQPETIFTDEAQREAIHKSSIQDKIST